MNNVEVKGVQVLMPTVFDEKGDLDLEVYKEHISYLESTGVDGIVSMSSVGEFYALNFDDFKKVALAARSACNKMVLGINCSYQNLRGTIDRIQYAESIGADYAMIYRYHYTQSFTPDQYYEYIRLISMAAPSIKFMIYDNPRESKGFKITKELYDRLIGDFEQIEAVVVDITNLHEMAWIDLTILMKQYGNKILATDEAGLMPIMFCGGKGCLSPYGLAIPEFMAKYYDACKNGNRDEALRFYQTLTRYPWEKNMVGINIQGHECPLFPGTFTTSIGNTDVILAKQKAGTLFSGSVTTSKALAEAAGRKVGNPQLPYLPPSPKMNEFAKAWLDDINKG